MPIKDPLESTSLLQSSAAVEDKFFIISWRIILIIIIGVANALTFMELILFSVSLDPELSGTPLESPKSSIIAYFVGAIISSFPGGLAAEKYGGKLVLLYAMLMFSISSAVLPPYIGTNKALLTTFRGIQGCCEGLILPSSFHLISAWFPDHETSLALSATLCSLDVGLWVAVGVSGAYMKTWAYEVHLVVVAIIGICWCIAHALLTSATPEWHPRISLPEVQHITRGRPKPIALSDASSVSPIPYKVLFTHPALVSIYITHALTCSVLSMLMVLTPAFFETKFNFDITSAARFVYLPAVTGIICSLVGGLLTDRLIAHGQNVDVKKRDVRVRVTTIALLGLAVGIILLNFVSSSGGVFFIFAIMAGCFSSGAKNGWMSNIFDVAPSHAGIVTAIMSAVGFIPAAIATTVTYTYLTDSTMVSFLIGWGGSSIAVIALLIANLIFSMGCSTDTVLRADD